MHIGSLTGGGDCPGLNAVIRAVTLALVHQQGARVTGIRRGFLGLLTREVIPLGFDSAVAVVAEALDRLETTARSHGRVMIAETMGRYAGWIALEGGMAGAADVILLPELPFSVAAVLQRCREREAGPGDTLICVAEGAHAAGSAMTVAQTLADSPDPLRLGGIGA